MNPKLLLFFLLVSISTVATSQSDLRIGQWKDHLPYNGGTTVTQSETRVYYGTEFAILSIFKSDTSKVEFFSKVDGLSDAGPSWLKYHPGLKTLIIGYKNGNIDLLDTNGITNINDLERNTSIQGDKSIRKIYIDDGSLAYMSTSFGLVILNLVTGQFTSTVFTNTGVNGFTIHDGKYYVATDKGVYCYNPNSGQIIEDFSNWLKIPIQGLPVNYISADVATFQGKLYAGGGADLYKWNGSEFEKLYEKEGFFHENGIFCAARPTYSIEDETGRIWYADEYPPFRLAQNNFTPCDDLIYNTPYSGSVSEMEVKNGILYVATGGVSESYSYATNKDGFYTFDRMKWETYNQFNTPELATGDLENFFRILPHPTENKFYVGSFYGGVVEYDYETFKVYNDTNSSLQGAVGDEARERVAGMAFDEGRNLWISNYLAPRPLSVLKADGTWKSFDFPCTNITNVSQLVVDQRGYKWITLYSRSAGLVVYDDGGTIDNESDDRCIQLSTSNTELPKKRYTR